MAMNPKGHIITVPAHACLRVVSEIKWNMMGSTQHNAGHRELSKWVHGGDLCPEKGQTSFSLYPAS